MHYVTLPAAIYLLCTGHATAGCVTLAATCFSWLLTDTCHTDDGYSNIGR